MSKIYETFMRHESRGKADNGTRSYIGTNIFLNITFLLWLIIQENGKVRNHNSYPIIVIKRVTLCFGRKPICLWKQIDYNKAKYPLVTKLINKAVAVGVCVISWGRGSGRWIVEKGGCEGRTIKTDGLWQKVKWEVRINQVTDELQKQK